MEPPSVSGQGTADTRPLLFFFDLETTGLYVYEERITEIAAKVVGEPASTVKQTSYTSLVRATKSVSPKAQEITGINDDMLKEEHPLSVVFPEFLKWLVDAVKEASDGNTVYYPVLVAHNGFNFDYPLLLAEIKRTCTSELNFQRFKENNIHFADTLHHLRKAKEEGHVALLEVQNLGLEKIYCCCVQKEYKGHRALPDVENLEELFTVPALQDLLSSLTKRTATEQIHEYEQRYEQTMELYHAFQQQITEEEAKKLADLNLTYSDLCEIKQSCSEEEFIQELLKKGMHKDNKSLAKKVFSILPATL